MKYEPRDLEDDTKHEDAGDDYSDANAAGKKLSINVPMSLTIIIVSIPMLCTQLRPAYYLLHTCLLHFHTGS